MKQIYLYGLSGPDKKYKDAATWRARYAEIYFGMES